MKIVRNFIHEMQSDRLNSTIILDATSTVLPMPDPIPSEYFIEEAKRLVENAAAKSISMRILGALAVRIHCSEFVELHRALGRLGGATEFTDIDVMTYGDTRDKLEPFFKSLGYNPEPRVRKTPVIWAYRQMYIEPKGQFHVDVFFDTLEMSHTIDFKNRLEVDRPTISLADLVLEKMQIHHINEKDIKDTIVVIRAHPIGDWDKECINQDYIARLLSNDWGFYHTVTLNLNKTKLLLSDYAISQEDKADVTAKIDQLISRIEKEPKSMRFNMRAKMGEKKKWYNDVEETIRS